MEKFYNEEVCNSLVKVLKSTCDNKVVCVDGAWGAGKTFFCKRLVDDNHNEFAFVEIDAFEHDFCDDPLIALASEMSKVVDDKGKKQYMRKVSSLLSPLLNKNKEISMLFDPSSATSMVSDVVSKYIKRKMDECLELESSIEGMKNELSKIVAQNYPKKVVVVIDELDRCRPSFSLEIIEKIKHVFSVEGMHFLLSMNKRQMLASIDHAYGISSSKESYLEKFIDFTITLDSPSTHRGNNGKIGDHVDYAIERVKKDFGSMAGEEFADNVGKCISLIAHKNDIGFRGIDRLVDKCLTCYLLADIESLDEREEAHAFYLCGCVFISLYNRNELSVVFKGDASERFCSSMLINGFVFKSDREFVNARYQSEPSPEEKRLGGEKYYGFFSVIGKNGGQNLAYYKYSSYHRSLIDKEEAGEVFGKWCSIVSKIT